MELNFLERGVATLSPQWGLRRLHAKAALEQSLSMARGYDAARRDRRTESWRATGGSANAELAPALDVIRRRSRDMVRNNEWSGNAKRKLIAHMIGTGIAPRPKSTEAKNTKKVAVDAWDAFNENCDPQGLTDYYGIQAALAGEVVEGGAAFLRWYLRPSDFTQKGSALKVPLQCEVLEHDFLDTRRTEVGTNGNVIMHGVEYNGYGQRVAYWLFPVHPGELNTLALRSKYISERVPVEVCDHIFRSDRPGQITGVPWLAPTMLRMRDAADYEEAELVRKKIEACFTVFVKRSGLGATGLAQSIDKSQDAQGRQREKIGPGLIVNLADGEDTSFAQPAPSSGYVDHMERQLYAFAAGAGLTYEQVSGDASNVNYSSIREVKLDFWAVLDQWQNFMLIPQACRPAWRRFARAAAGRGLQISPDIPAEWTPPRRPWVDPLKDVQAELESIAGGLESWRESVRARGYDPDQFLAELTEDIGKLLKAGVKIGATPNVTGGEAPANSDQKPKKSTKKGDKNVKKD